MWPTYLHIGKVSMEHNNSGFGDVFPLQMGDF